jgi:ribosomal protein L29
MSKSSTNLTQLRDLPDNELTDQLARTRDELFRLHLGMHTNQVTSSAELKTKRHNIARILTLLNGRKSGIEKQAQKQAATPDAETTTKKSKSTKKSKA